MLAARLARCAARIYAALRVQRRVKGGYYESE
jgi:hypothetical protein